MNEIIQIKCPFDGAVLSVKNQPGIENKQVTCPICKNKYPFSQYRKVTPKPATDSDTEYPGGEDGSTQYGPAAGGTSKPEGAGLGQLRVEETNRIFVLKPGSFIIGRKSSTPQADFQIDTGAGRAMSRAHLVVTVTSTGPGTYKHKVRLFKEKVNATSINGTPLSPSDTIILSDGDVIKMPDATLRFEIPDSEKTSFY